MALNHSKFLYTKPQEFPQPARHTHFEPFQHAGLQEAEMKLLKILFGNSVATPTRTTSTFQTSAGQSRPPDMSASSSRRQLLKIALRDTLLCYGIPQHWVGATLMPVSLGEKTTGFHWRLKSNTGIPVFRCTWWRFRTTYLSVSTPLIPLRNIGC